jgi:hypothetical protein
VRGQVQDSTIFDKIDSNRDGVIHAPMLFPCVLRGHTRKMSLEKWALLGGFSSRCV